LLSRTKGESLLGSKCENRGSEPAVEIPKEPEGKNANGKGKASQKVTRGSSFFYA
jgi:hypothetical protein